MMTSAPTTQPLRQTMIDSQLKTVGIADAAVLAAFAAVPREAYLPPALSGLAYADAAHEVAPGRHLLAPLVLGLLLQRAAVQPGQKVLLVGSATGLSAAVLMQLGAHVTALESDPALAAMAEAAGVPTMVGPLVDGWAEAGPYDLVLFEGAIGMVPRAIAAQLAADGRIAAVLRRAGVGRAFVGPLARDGSPIGLPFLEVAAPDLPGFAPPRTFAF